MDQASTTTSDLGPIGVEARPVPGIDNGFMTTYRVRFDEAGPDARIRTSTLLRYAQDGAWRHSEAIGFDRRWYDERGLGWVVRAVHLERLEPIAMGETLRLSTAVIGHRRIWARRLGEFRSRDGLRVAVVTTDWVLLDARGRIIRIPPEFGTAFPNPELDADMLRVQVARDQLGTSLEVTVRPSDLDPMGHVNNAVYLDWTEEALAAAGIELGRVPSRIRVEYAASAGPGDVVGLTVGGPAIAWTVAIRRPDGTDLARVAGSGPDPG